MTEFTDDMKYIIDLEEENKKLKEEIRFLEECLDRKEKLNEKYRKEIDKLKSDLLYFDDVRAEYKSQVEIIKRLKEEIDKYEALYWRLYI